MLLAPIASYFTRLLSLPTTHCSYLWRPPGTLAPVPAAKSDIFTDRHLGVADKRALMKFLKGVVEAEGGEGPLKVGWSCSCADVGWR